jgi:hypothetical protein
LLKIPEPSLVVAGVRVCASGESAIAIGLDSAVSGQTIIPSSVFFPSLAATLGVTQLAGQVF